MMHRLRLFSLKPKHPNDFHIDSALGSRKNNFTIFSEPFAWQLLRMFMLLKTERR